MCNRENESDQLEMQLLFTIEQASKILGGMKISTIRKHVREGRLKRCEHLGDRPWYFTMRQLEDFINGEFDIEMVDGPIGNESGKEEA